MKTNILIAIIVGLVLGGLVYFSYTTYGKLQLTEVELKEAKAELVSFQDAKKKSDEALAQLTIDLMDNQTQTTKYITKLVKVPVSSDEKCVSPVLREALKEND